MTLNFRDHDVEDYVALKDMDDTDVGVLDDLDRACLREIGEYLLTTDARQRYAMWLLHKHFEPAEGEVFVERALRSAGTTETAPVKRSAYSMRGLNASGIRFDADPGTGVSLIGLEFTEPSDFDDVAPLGDHDGPVLADIAALLRSHGKIDRFGVKVIRNPLGLSPDELLLETCDTSTRTQHCEKASRDALSSGRTLIETTWRWCVVGGSTTPVVMQECAAGCTPVGEGHDLAHHNTQYDDESNN